MNPYSSLCDDFGVYVYLNTKMDLPTGRETVLHYFDGLRKTFPQMTDFDTRESGELVLEEDREQGSYRWVTLETRRLCSGYVNPPELEPADALHEHVLEVSPYHLGFNPLDVEIIVNNSETLLNVYSNHEVLPGLRRGVRPRCLRGAAGNLCQQILG